MAHSKQFLKANSAYLFERAVLTSTAKMKYLLLLPLFFASSINFKIVELFPHPEGDFNANNLVFVCRHKTSSKKLKTDAIRHFLPT